MDTASKPKSFGALIQGAEPVLVDFSAVWCGPCKAMEPQLHALKAKMGGRLTIIQIDIDKSPEAARRYQVQGVPTLILFKEGKILWRQSGLMPAAQIEQYLLPFLG
jgi:thioredoxin 1